MDKKYRLEELLAPYDVDTFFDNYYDRELLYIDRTDSRYYDSLLTVEEIDAYLSRNDIQYPSIRMAQQGRVLPLSDFTNVSVNGDPEPCPFIDINKVYEKFYNGATIVLQQMKSSLNNLTRLSWELDKELDFVTDANIYITPRNAQGFSAHFDNHGVFIMQIAGSKTWRLYDFARKLPLNQEDRARYPLSHLKPVKTIHLKPGDLLYIPRGMVHDAITGQDASVHITLGLYSLCWSEVISASLNQAATHQLLKQQIVMTSPQAIKIFQERYSKALDVFLESIEF